jgi:DNA-binding transcriptional LysR family regulator
MDLNQLDIFIKVAKYKSFSKAANKMYLSQPAISAQILSLEKELNVQLLNRTSKEVALTEAGEGFLRHAIDMLNNYHKAVSSLKNYNQSMSGELNVMASTVPCNSILPPLIKKFSSSYPDIYFNITEQNSDKIIENILKFNCEIGFTGSNIKDSRIKAYSLTDDELVIISPPSFNLPENIEAKELLKYKFIQREKGSATRKTFEKALKNKGIDISGLNICCEVNSLDALFRFVKIGMGISMVSRKVCENHPDELKISTIEDLQIKRNLFLVISAKRNLTPVAQAFFDFCVANTNTL